MVSRYVKVLVIGLFIMNSALFSMQPIIQGYVDQQGNVANMSHQPSTPMDGKIYQGSDGGLWKYNAGTQKWESAGATRQPTSAQIAQNQQQTQQALSNLDQQYNNLQTNVTQYKNTPEYKKLSANKQEAAVDNFIWQQKPSLELYCYYIFKQNTNNASAGDFEKFIIYIIGRNGLLNFDPTLFEEAVNSVVRGVPLSYAEQLWIIGKSAGEGLFSGAATGALGGAVAVGAANRGSAESAESVGKATVLGAAGAGALGAGYGAYQGYKDVQARNAQIAKARTIAKTEGQGMWERLKNYLSGKKALQK